MANSGQVWTARDLKNHLPVRCYLIDKNSQESGNIVRLDKFEGGYLTGYVLEESYIVVKDNARALIFKPVPFKNKGSRKIRVHINNDKTKLVSLFPFGNRWEV